MKRYFILWACAAAALLFFACQKEKADSEKPAPKEPEIEVPAGALGVITATAMDTKTITPDGVHVYWENADSIALFAVESSLERTRSAIYSVSLTQPSASATFVRKNNVEPIATTIDAADYYFALYPEKALNKWASSMATAGTRRVYVDIPTNQTAVVGGWDKKAAVLAAQSTTSTFQFKHIMAYVKFTVDGSSTPFVKMTVTAKSGEYLTGTNTAVIYKSDGIEYDPSYTSGTYYSTATIAKSDGSVFGAGTYYVAVLPGTFAKGLAFVFENAAGKVCYKNSPKNVVLDAGEVADLGTVGTLNYADPAGAFTPYLYKEGGVNKGVVFWRDPFEPTNGLAVSAKYTNTKWHASATTFDDAESFDIDDSEANHNYIITKSGYSSSDYLAVGFCQSLGDGWRLPSKAEFDDLVRAWCGHTGTFTLNSSGVYNYTDAEKTAQGTFDALFADCEEGDVKKLAIAATSWYWLGQADKSNYKIRRTKVSSNYCPSAAGANNASYVRCIKNVQIQ